MEVDHEVRQVGRDGVPDEDIAMPPELVRLLALVERQGPHVERCLRFLIQPCRIELRLHLGDAPAHPGEFLLSRRVAEIVQLVLLLLAAQHGEPHRTHRKALLVLRIEIGGQVRTRLGDLLRRRPCRRSGRTSDSDRRKSRGKHQPHQFLLTLPPESPPSFPRAAQRRLEGRGRAHRPQINQPSLSQPIASHAPPEPAGATRHRPAPCHGNRHS